MRWCLFRIILNNKQANMHNLQCNFDKLTYNGLAYEPAQQAFTILNEKRGFILFTPIFVD